MEPNNNKKEDVEAFVKRKVYEAVGFPLEDSSKSMTPLVVKFIRPNNYRRLLNIKLIKGSGVSNILTTLPYARQNPQNHLIDVPNYRNSGISIQVCKEKIIGIYSQIYSNGKKYWYRIERETDKEVNDVIEAKKEEIKDKIDSAMLLFCEEFKLNFRFEKPIWLRSETAIHGDDYIDRIPRDLIIHDTLFKKVYKDDLEFKSGKGEEPVVHLKNYITNRAVEKVVPEIVKELNVLHGRFDEFNVLNASIDRLHEVTLLEIENKKLHMSVLYDMKDTLHKISDSRSNLEAGSLDLNPQCSDSLDQLPTFSRFDSRVDRVRKIKRFCGW